MYFFCVLHSHFLHMKPRINRGHPMVLCSDALVSSFCVIQCSNPLVIVRMRSGSVEILGCEIFPYSFEEILSPRLLGFALEKMVDSFFLRAPRASCRNVFDSCLTVVHREPTCDELGDKSVQVVQFVPGHAECVPVDGFPGCFFPIVSLHEVRLGLKSWYFVPAC
jgi:hypothetical protein